MKLFRRLWFWMRRRQFETDLEEERRQHLEWKTQSAIEQGISAVEARRAAHLEFGNPALAKEQPSRPPFRCAVHMWTCSHPFHFDISTVFTLVQPADAIQAFRVDSSTRGIYLLDTALKVKRSVAPDDCK